MNNLPSCVQAGIGTANPSYSGVGLYSDFGDDKLTNLAVSNIAQLTNIVPQNIEIIVVLNDPTDKLISALKKFDRLIVLTTNKNLGCVVKNIGYQIAQGDYIFSIDHDVFVKNSYAFTKCIDFLNNNPNSALVGPCGGNIVDKYWKYKAYCSPSMKSSEWMVEHRTKYIRCIKARENHENCCKPTGTFGSVF